MKIIIGILILWCIWQEIRLLELERDRDDRIEQEYRALLKSFDKEV